MIKIDFSFGWTDWNCLFRYSSNDLFVYLWLIWIIIMPYKTYAVSLKAVVKEDTFIKGKL